MKDQPDDDGPSLRSSRLLVLGLVLLLAPLVTAAGLLTFDADRNYLPTGDNAMIEMRTSDVGSHDVLTGLYSREGWNHPGPALFYTLAAPYRLSGSSSLVLPVGALFLNAASLAGIVFIAARRGGATLALCTLVGCALLVHSFGPARLQDIWNPQVPVLPFALLVFLVWDLACGAAWALPVAVAVASFAAQVHVGYVALALPLAALGAACLLVRRRGNLRRLIAPVAVAAAVAVMVWLPPLVDEVRHQPGNLAKITTYFREHGDEARTVPDGVRVVASQFEPVPEWVAGTRATNPFSAEPAALTSTVVPVLLLPFAAAAWLAWRRRAREPLALVLVLSAALVLGAASVARTIGAVLDYRLRWTMVLGAFAAVAVAWVTCTVLRPRSPVAVRRAAAAGAVGVLAGLSASSTVAAVRADVPEEELVLRDLVEPVAHALEGVDGPVVLRTDEAFNAYGLGLLVQLERRDLDVRVDDQPSQVQALGRHRVHAEGPLGAVISVATGRGLDARLRSGTALVAYHGPQPVRERAELLARAAELEEAHDAGRLTDTEYFFEVVALKERLGVAVGVVLERPGQETTP